MKTIAIDFSPVEEDKAGIGQYSFFLTKYLLKLDKKNKYIIYSTKPYTNLKGKNVENVVIKKPTNFRARGIRWMTAVNNDFNKRKADLFISYSNHFFSLINNKTIQFIHDIAPIKYPQFYNLDARLLYPFTTKLALNKASRIITVSNTVKKELNALAKVKGNKISVIYPSINEYRVIKRPTKVKIDIPKDFILTVSTLQPRKNITSGIKAYAKLKQEGKIPKSLKYVITGRKGWHYKEIFKLVESLKLKNDVIFTDFVDDAVLKDLYTKSKLFLYLSYYEGFGMPILEALMHGSKVLLSDIPVFKECFSKYAIFAKVDNVEDIADKILVGLNIKKKSFIKEIKKQYSWEKSAKEFLQIINEYDETKNNKNKK